MIIAETGGDMSRFPTPGRFAPWAGTCPGSNESAGRIKSTNTRPGTLTSRAPSASPRCPQRGGKDTYLAAKYRRIASRRGPIKAIAALEHAILVATWNMITNGVSYQDLGGDYYTQPHPDRTKQRALNQLRQLVYNVTLKPPTSLVERESSRQSWSHSFWAIRIRGSCSQTRSQVQAASVKTVVRPASAAATRRS